MIQGSIGFSFNGIHCLYLGIFSVIKFLDIYNSLNEKCINELHLEKSTQPQMQNERYQVYLHKRAFVYPDFDSW